MGKGLYKGTNSIEFHRRFQSDDDCYEYLSELQWGQTAIQLSEQNGGQLVVGKISGATLI